MDLFENNTIEQNSQKYVPLASRMRPQTLADIKGQAHILGKESLLARLIQSDSFGSILLYGPPGCGKTSLAEVIANETRSKFVRINAVLSNVAELREILRAARYQENANTLLFIDEIHRFNKAQQDLLLPDVENGTIRLIGATTHNPGFYIIPPLVSRSHLFRLEPLDADSMLEVLKHAASTPNTGLGQFRCNIDEPVLRGLATLSNGDMRRALNALETLVLSHPIGSSITEKELLLFANERQIRYDANEDEHYDTASAFIKSIRGNDPDASLYWLAKMLEGGEDPRFIARRLVILASEDVGLADSRALPLAMATFQACELIGMPECRINLAHAVSFLATAPKSNSAYLALDTAQKYIKSQPHQSVPIHLRDGSTATSKQLGYGKDYKYSHNYPENISGQNYMTHPEQFYFPKEIGSEAAIKQRLDHWKSLKDNIDDHT